MNEFPFLLAAGLEDVVGWIVIALIVIVSTVGQMLAKMRQMQPPAGGPKPPRPVPVDLADEIEVFMRRVLGNKEAEAQPPEEPPPVERPVRQPVQAPAAVEQPARERVVEHVEKYLDTREFSGRAGQLGREVVQADEQFEQHVHQAFDHNVSRFTSAVEAASSTAAVAPAPGGAVAAPIELPPTIAAGWAALLGSTESVAQAIVLSEIIHRPEERWA